MSDEPRSFNVGPLIIAVLLVLLVILSVHTVRQSKLIARQIAEIKACEAVESGP